MKLGNMRDIGVNKTDLPQNKFDPDKRLDIQRSTEKINQAKFDPDQRIPLEVGSLSNQTPGSFETGAESHEVNPVRELSEAEKEKYAVKFDYPIDKMDKFQIDDNGLLHLDTIRQDLEGKTAENGVPYARRTVEYRGEKIEGVFPKFHSVFDTKLDPDKLRTPAFAKYCNADLKEQVEQNPKLREKFTPDQLNDIVNGKTPRGYVWHHNEEPGRMQLVDQVEHEGARHTGGSYIWGYNAGSHGKAEGVSF